MKAGGATSSGIRSPTHPWPGFIQKSQQLLDAAELSNPIPNIKTSKGENGPVSSILKTRFSGLAREWKNSLDDKALPNTSINGFISPKKFND